MINAVVHEFGGIIRYSLGDSHCLTFDAAADAMAAAQRLSADWNAAGRRDGIGCAINLALHRGAICAFRSFLYGKGMAVAARVQRSSSKRWDRTKAGSSSPRRYTVHCWTGGGETGSFPRGWRCRTREYSACSRWRRLVCRQSLLRALLDRHAPVDAVLFRRVIARRLVVRAAVVPDHDVAHAPLVACIRPRAGSCARQLIDQHVAILRAEPFDQRILPGSK